ncbi:MAG: serine/threonine protein kinase [Sandaracinaceae bacterium]|nr:MAG: serine/threonine protein kinase [Sandaracinaceae bacterium]
MSFGAVGGLGTASARPPRSDGGPLIIASVPPYGNDGPRRRGRPPSPLGLPRLRGPPRFPTAVENSRSAARPVYHRRAHLRTSTRRSFPPMATARSTSRSSKDTYLGRVVAGRYRLEALLGEGGMGVVYRARHVLIDRVVALKLIRPDLRGETHLRAWMLREARAANRVDHAHIVEIHDVGETEEGELYLVMEYLTGTSLSSEIAKGQMPITRAVDILEQMTAALSRAHDLGVVHRDLKSDNIMLTTRGGRRDFVKILDFGLAALARDPRLAPKGAVFGTPEYMSPEQARGDDAVPTSDLYALGILFFEMTTGQLPFRSSDRDTLLEMQRSSPSPRPVTLRQDLPDTAERIILRLLEKDPRRRFRDGHHLSEQLKALQRTLPSTTWEVQQQAEPPAAAPPPPPAPTPGVVEWSRRAAYFARMVARAYPNGRAPADVQQAADQMWETAARASRLEGELASHQKKLEAIERRGRALRAEIGRKVEELAEEESRTLRDAAAERERVSSLQQRLGEANQRWEAAHQRAIQAAAGSDGQTMRAAFEEVGGMRSRAQTLQEIIQENQQRVQTKENAAADLRRQIDELRAQLQRYSDALENDLSAGRERIATRVREALGYEKTFAQASEVLMTHLADRPECSELIEELRTEEARFNRRAEQSQVAPAAPPDRLIKA